MPNWASVRAGNEPAVPVDAVGGDRLGDTAEILGKLGHIGIDREAGREATAAHRQPLHALDCLGQIAADLHDAADIAVRHTDGTYLPLQAAVLS